MTPPPNGDNSATGSLTKDEAFQILENGRRRAALRFLFTQKFGTTHPIRRVAEAVAAWEYDTSLSNVDYDDRHRVHISLYQTHLPRLADHDIIEYNQERGVAKLRPKARALEPLLADGLRPRDATELRLNDDDAVDISQMGETSNHSEVSGE